MTKKNIWVERFLLRKKISKFFGQKKNLGQKIIHIRTRQVNHGPTVGTFITATSENNFGQKSQTKRINYD